MKNSLLVLIVTSAVIFSMGCGNNTSIMAADYFILQTEIQNAQHADLFRMDDGKIYFVITTTSSGSRVELLNCVRCAVTSWTVTDLAGKHAKMIKPAHGNEYDSALRQFVNRRGF